MRRVLPMVAMTALLLVGGCGGRSYDLRLEKTVDDWKYKKRLDDLLMKAPEGKFKPLFIFLRPPKSLAGPAKESLYTAIEPGTFDLNEMFYEKENRLFVLARVKRPKDTSKKKAAPKPEDTATRGDFTQDVIAILNNFYSTEIDAAKAKEESKGKKPNKFKFLKTEGNGKTVKVYFFGPKTTPNTPYEIALIFEYPKAEESSLVSKIELMLESFETGKRAERAFNGAVTEEEQAEGATSSAPVAF